MKQINRTDLQRMINALIILHDKTGNHVNISGHVPSENSKAANELKKFSNSEIIKTAYAQGSVLIEAAADHLMAFTKTVTEPAQTIALWTCVRAILESGAIAVWLLDPYIDVKTRVQRSFAFRYEGLSQRLKYVRVSGDNDYINFVIDIRDNVVKKALNLGYNPILDKRDKRIGLATLMPSTTQLIGDMLDEEASYRLLSAVAHAHPWALQELSFQTIKTETDLFLEKNIEPKDIADLCITAAKAFSRPVWFKSQLFGWNLESLEVILGSVYDSLCINNLADRFWV